MTYRPTIALVCAALLIGGCGGGDAADSAPAPLTGAGGATSTPAASASGAATANGADEDRASSARSPTTVRACSLIPRADVSRALGRAAPAPRGAGSGSATTCEFDAGHAILKVSLLPAAAGAQQALRRQPVVRPQRRVQLTGAAAVARTLIKPGPAGSQTIMTIVKGRTTAQILLTDRTLRHGSLMSMVIDLGRAAAARLTTS